MKKLTLIALIVIFGACQSQQSADEDSIQQETVLTNYTSYGEEISSDNPVTPPVLLSKMEESDSMNIKLQASIVKTCAMKGCWMDVDMGNGETMKVTFKDYGFFVPKEGMEGKNVVMEGVVSRELINVETLRHYAEDAGEDDAVIAAIIEPEVKLSFEASGVLIAD